MHGTMMILIDDYRGRRIMIKLDEFNYEELVALNEAIVDRLNQLDTLEALQAMASLTIGAKVSFESKSGRQVGHVVKRNTKTVRVVTEDGRYWKVPPHLLSIMENLSAPNVVQIEKNKYKNKNKK